MELLILGAPLILAVLILFAFPGLMRQARQFGANRGIKRREREIKNYVMDYQLDAIAIQRLRDKGEL